MAAGVAQESSEISCVLIPMNGGPLLLPNVCVAEILPWRRIKTHADLPDWCLGILAWRGAEVPVVSFDCINNQDLHDDGAGRCMVVMNRTRLADGIPFYAFAATELPRMMQLADGDLSSVPGRLKRAEVAAVQLGTETAIIPNLEVVERSVTELAGDFQTP